jgi:hypothetical protein
MARNGSGTYNLPAGNPVTTGTTISSTWANSTLNDMATALTGSVASDGQTTPSANLPMGTFAHTNVGNATVRNMYPSAGQVQDGVITYLTSVAGTDVITAVGAVGMTAYATGQCFTFIAAGANTGAVTININSIGAKSITKNGTTALDAGDIASGGAVEVFYDGTRFQLLNVAKVSVNSFSAGTTGFTPSTATSGAVTLAGTLAVANGGTGVSSVGTSGNVLTSNGTAWTSAALPSTYRVKCIFTGTTYTKPSDVKSLYAFVYGSTGGVSAASRGSVGGIGYSETYYASPSASYSYTIGAGGANTGTAGGTTTFGAMSVTGSAGVTTTTGGLGGVGSGGTFNATGGTGGNFSTNWGGSGGAASRAGNGGNGGNGGATIGGGGGTGGNAGSTAPAATAQGAAATVKAAGALSLPWFASATEIFDGGDVGAISYLGAVGASFSNVTDVFGISRLIPRLGFVAFGIGSTAAPNIGAAATAGANGLIYLVEVL